MDRMLLDTDNLWIFERDGRFFIRYDAGAHMIQMREDEISEAEAVRAATDDDAATDVLFFLQQRLLAAGIDAYRSNLPE